MGTGSTPGSLLNAPGKAAEDNIRAWAPVLKEATWMPLFPDFCLAQHSITVGIHRVNLGMKESLPFKKEVNCFGYSIISQSEILPNITGHIDLSVGQSPYENLKYILFHFLNVQVEHFHKNIRKQITQEFKSELRVSLFVCNALFETFTNNT